MSAAAGGREVRRRGAALDALLRLDTPEQVRLDLPLAGLGSRFAALLVDLVAMALLGAVASAVLWLFAYLLQRGGSGALAGELLTVAGPALGFALFWGYFFFFEAFRDGATPGKRWLGLRVVHDNGTALSLSAAATRSLLRIVDVQPGVTGLLGGAVMLFHPRSKRLGDLVAATVVVRDLPVEFPEPAMSHSDPAVSGAGPTWSEEQRNGVERFLSRARGLAPAVRAQLAQRWCAELGLSPSAPGGALAALSKAYQEERLAHSGAPPSASDRAARLVRARVERWRSFHREVLSLGGKSRRKISAEHAARFASAYRAVAADLARARTFGVGLETRWSLERLLARAHRVFHPRYRNAAFRPLRYLLEDLPQLVRRRGAQVLLATAAFFGSGALSCYLVATRPALEPVLVSASMVERAERVARDPALDYRDTFEGGWVGAGGLTSLVLFNNVQVAFLCFAGGVLFGFGSLLLLLFNGVVLGGVLGSFALRGQFSNILAWVAPHGPFELTAITIAGAAGLWLGGALWNPGRLGRARALSERGREALALLGGAVLLLVLAAPLEGFVAPARVEPFVKHAVGLLCIALLGLWIAGGGRRAPVRRSPDA